MEKCRAKVNSQFYGTLSKSPSSDAAMISAIPPTSQITKWENNDEEEEQLMRIALIYHSACYSSLSRR